MSLYDAYNKIADFENYLKIIDKETGKIQCGLHFFIKDFLTLKKENETRYFLFKVPPEDGINAKFVTNTNSEFILELYEGAICGNCGEQIYAINNNRNSDKQPRLLSFASPEIINIGNLIWRAQTGIGENTGVYNASGYEIIPKANTAYIWKIIKVGKKEGFLDYNFFWYENEYL